ncbi:tetraacyldisaccharide 4'-kinase [Hyunsoonleella sp. 2307UL5-6]|uniref:tetraacyldisaccharide 4'-kinase n=1 Tax=Hyunsoonleella sp. 2307UL5-6 TaxID=3384768 RepID=UPI0039BCED50
MKLLRKILFPIVPIYYMVTWLRNKFYDFGIKTSTTYDVPVICVGNLSVGGTGKTPMIEYLIILLKAQHKVATLSRGYKRKSVGFQLADNTTVMEDIGDEPFQFHNKFGSSIYVAVDSNRVNGIAQLLQQTKPPNIVLLDDAFQHRKVKAGFNIMLTTYNNPFFKDIVLPTGNLREPRQGYKRANIIVVTKCPLDIADTEKAKFIKKINALNHQQVFFSSISYSNIVLSKTEKVNLDVINNFTLVTGIANAEPLVRYLKSKNLKFEHLNYKDHHQFSVEDISNLELHEKLLTTEKDYMRLKKYKSLERKLFYLPIKMVISESEVFDGVINDFIKSF